MRANQWLLLATVLLTAACAEQRVPTAEESDVHPLVPDDDRREPMERLARRVALALADPAFREYVRASLDHSPYVERKLPFSGFLDANGARGAAALARADGSAPSTVAADLAMAGKLEFYFPVHGQRAAWRGDEDLLVATEVRDHEAPVAFNTRGERIVLDPKTPPVTPVLAVVPQETDFDAPGARLAQQYCDTCDGGGTGYPPPPPPPPPSQGDVPPSLHMTYFHVDQDFEGWLKGDPEFEIHILGPVSQTDTTHFRTLYCIGEHGSVYWDENDGSWVGDVTLMGPNELAAFHTAFPLNHYSIFAVEDDDTACQIKVNKDRFGAMINAITAAYRDYKAAKDSIGLNGKTLTAARSSWNVLTAVADFFKTNDDVIGFALQDATIGYYNAKSNWSWIGEGANRFGGVKLELR